MIQPKFYLYPRPEGYFYVAKIGLISINITSSLPRGDFK